MAKAKRRNKKFIVIIVIAFAVTGFASLGLYAFSRGVPKAVRIAYKQAKNAPHGEPGPYIGTTLKVCRQGKKIIYVVDDFHDSHGSIKYFDGKGNEIHTSTWNRNGDNSGAVMDLGDFTCNRLESTVDESYFDLKL